MKRLLSLLLLTAGAGQLAYAQCEEPETRRVLTVGDSWSVFMNANSTFNNVFRKWGHSDKRYFTNLIISENGAETDDFLGETKQQEIAAQLEANPTIDVVHLSIGGNDVLGEWYIDWEQDQVDSLEAAVTVRLLEIMEFIKSVRPGIRIVWSGYAYPNFGEVIGSLPSAAQSSHPFYDTWESMGLPDFLAINNILISFSQSVQAYTEQDPQVDFVMCPGILQHVFGQTSELPVEPGGTYQPFEAPMPYGFPEYPSPRNTMTNYGFFTDAFHLSGGGYQAFIDYQFQKFYHKYFMDDQYILATDGAETGGVSSDGVVSAAPMVGETAGMDHAAVLHFSTTAMPDTGVAKAQIFLRRVSQVGNNLYTSPLELRVTRGAFGSSAIVEAEDFATEGEASGTPCVFGSNGGDGHWVKIAIPDDLLPYITNESDVQFHISSPEAAGSMVTFNDASDPDFAPVLNLTYGPSQPASVNDLARSVPELKVYPNPSEGIVTLDAGDQHVISVELFNMQGSATSAAVLEGNKAVDLSALPSGTYLLHVVTANGSAWKRVFKR